MFYEAEFWVAVAFVILMAIFAYVGVHRTVLKALDHRSERIKAELDDARRLKDEATKLLAVPGRTPPPKRGQDIITNARAEAERIAAGAKTNGDFVARRHKTAEQIALAEAQARRGPRRRRRAAITAASTILCNR